MSIIRSFQVLLVFALCSILFSSPRAYSPSSIVSPSRVRQVSWKPRAFVYEGLLTDLECDHLISLAKSELKRSAVADNVSGKSKLSQVRTSSGMFIPKGKVSSHRPRASGITDDFEDYEGYCNGCLSGGNLSVVAELDRPVFQMVH